MTTDKARQLGFEVVETDEPDDLSIALRRFMDLFGEARTAKFGHTHPAVDALRECAKAIEELLPESLSGAKVKPSVGQGNWASVPWIAVLDPRETDTTRHGVYPVLLFSEDLTAVEMTIAQGVTDLTRTLGRPDAVRELDRRAQMLRPALITLGDLGFALDKDFDLGGSVLGRGYVASTVVHRRFTADLLNGTEVTDSAVALLGAYADLLVSGTLRAVSEDPAPGTDTTMMPPEAPLTATREDVGAAALAFWEAVEVSGLRLAPDLVASFFAALATKPFVILTGQSGSGKTQLAMRFGEWVGSDDQGRPRSLVVPVRPDWTGPEYLFGYPDALRSAPGKEVWAVPDARPRLRPCGRLPNQPSRTCCGSRRNESGSPSSATSPTSSRAWSRDCRSCPFLRTRTANGLRWKVRTECRYHATSSSWVRSTSTRRRTCSLRRFSTGPSPLNFEPRRPTSTQLLRRPTPVDAGEQVCPPEDRIVQKGRYWMTNGSTLMLTPASTRWQRTLLCSTPCSASRGMEFGASRAV